MRIKPHHLAVLSLLTAAACADPIPAEPTWFGDVQGIMQANCGRCHGADPYAPAIAGFRLDRYVANDTTSLDAYDYSQQIVEHAADMMSPPMPLDVTLGDRQREILRRWLEAGTPKGSRDNTPPTATLVSPTDAMVTVDQQLDLSFRANDADGDGLVVAIGARPMGSQDRPNVLFSGLGGGLRSVTVDTGLLASQQHFEILALVDDGFSDNPADNETDVVLLPDVLVDHGARGTAPTVQLIQPNGGDTLIGTTTIVWSASDPDPGDVLTIDLDLVQVDAAGNETVAQSIASGLPNDVPQFDWDTSGVPTDNNGVPIEYKVRVTATDSGAKNVRSDESDLTFTIAAPTMTDLTWNDVKPIFATYCVKCHGQPPSVPKNDYFRLDKYNADDPVAPINSDIGVYEQRSLVYQRLVVAGTMPPATEPKPSAAEVAMVGDWIQGGAPQSSGPVDAPPTFVWSTPNNSATTNVSSTSVTLQWSASDDMGAVTGTLSIAKLSGPKTDMLAKCDATLTGWTDIAGADVTTGSLAYTLPGTGCWCLRGVVTDSASQNTTAIATKPVRYVTGVGGIYCP